jgi:hypothetical protein
VLLAIFLMVVALKEIPGIHDRLDTRRKMSVSGRLGVTVPYLHPKLREERVTVYFNHPAGYAGPITISPSTLDEQ